MRINNMRFVIAAITTIGAFVTYVSRINLSIAIIAMVDDGSHDTHRHQVAATTLAPLINADPNSTGAPPSLPNNLTASTLALAVNQTRGPLRSIFPAIRDRMVPLITQTKFDWDQTDQGNILGAFFYGYILFQIPGARIAETVGAKWIIMASNIGSTVVSLTFPMATQLNSIYLLMMLRFFMGLCQSAFYPAAYVLFCRWLPESERSVLLPIMFIGSSMGSISTYIASSYLITSPLGWPSVFYVSGAVCLLVSILWCVFGSSDPGSSRFISDRERLFIEAEIDNQSSNNASMNNISLVVIPNNELDHKHNNLCYSTQKDANNNNSLFSSDHNKELKMVTSNLLKQQQQHLQQQPLGSMDKLDGPQGVRARNSVMPEASWSKLIRSVPVWTLVLSMYGNEWSNVVLCYELPTYLNTALEFPIEQNGVINSFFQLAYAIASPIMSALGAYLLERHLCGMRKIHLRKTFQSLATFGQFFCFISVPMCGSNRGMIILFMFLAIIFRSCSNAGDIMVPGDLSPDYAGTIFAFANSVGNTAGFFAPLLVGVFVHSDHKREEWTPFWLFTAAIMACSGLIFLVFGEVRRQDFDVTPTVAIIEDTMEEKKKESIGKKNNNKLDEDQASTKRNKLITKVILKDLY